MSSEQPMASSSTQMEIIHNTLTEFHDQCRDWERDFETLFVELNSLAADSLDGSSTAFDGRSGSGQLLAQQERISDDVTGLRQLVEEQGRIFSKLFAVQLRAAQPGENASMSRAEDQASAHAPTPVAGQDDPVVQAVLAEIQQLYDVAN